MGSRVHPCGACSARRHASNIHRMRKTIALLSAAAALSAAAQPAAAMVPMAPVKAPPAATAPTPDEMATLQEQLRRIEPAELQLNLKPLDRRPSIAMPSCPECRYHALETRS